MKKYSLLVIGLAWLMFGAGIVHAAPIVWDVGAAGAPPHGDANSQTGTFDQIGFNAQTSTVQFDSNNDGEVSIGDAFLDSGDLRVTTLLASTIIDTEGLNQLNGFELTARWTNVEGSVTAVTVDPNNGDTRIDVRYTRGTVYLFLDPALDSLFNPSSVGSGGTGFINGTPVATLNVKDGIGHTFIDFTNGDIQNQGSADLQLEFTDALDGFWYDASGTVKLDPVGSGLTVLLDMNIDQTTRAAGPPGALYTANSNENGSILVNTGCIDIEKQVSVDGGQTWFDADVWDDAPTTGMAATYRLIVENCGGIVLTNVTLSDIMPSSTSPEIIYFDEPIGSLQPGESKTFTAGSTGFAQLDAPTRCLDEWQSVEGAPDGMYLNTAYVTTNEGYNDQDPAWVSCRMQEGACRMTGGSVTLNDFIDPEGTDRVFLSYVDDTYNDATQTIKGTSKKSAPQIVTWVTTGGQIGAPSTDPATGHWTHTQHAGKEGIFTFLAGTASAPPGTEISNIDCADPGWCVQARCAPFKQIFWDGIGYFANKHGGDDFNASFPASCTVTPGGPQKDGTLHYFRAMVGDFGENDRRNRQPDNTTCDWVPGGFDVSEVSLLDAVTDPQFGDKGGQTCDKCADYYKIEIYCGDGVNEPMGNVIYTFTDFIDGGNFQIHPETSEQCTVDLFTLAATGASGNKKK